MEASMNVGDLVECKLEIYGLGIVLATGADKSPWHKRTTVQWFDPPRWCMPDGDIATHEPSNLEKICK
jgi:hypothetical protein